MLLKNLVWHTGRGDVGGDLRLLKGRIAGAEAGLAPRRRERVLDLAGYRALPGLINAHDHLSLNLLPHLGDPPYPSIYRFAEEIYRPDRPPIRDNERTSIWDRLTWGGYKNLISGVTTVVHHDALPRLFFYRDFPVRVLRHYAWTHSLGYGDPATAFVSARQRPFIIHAAEGVDEECRREVDRLDELGVLGPRTVLVHGIALTAAQRRRLAAVGVSLVWCPASNLRLYGRTAEIDELKHSLDLALGTDSTLTGSPTLLDEVRAAAATGLASGVEILDMVTAGAARIFGIRERGWIGVGAAADLTVVPDVSSVSVSGDPGAAAAAALLAARPRDLAMVAVAGKPRLADAAVVERLGLGAPNAALEGRLFWLHGDPGALKRRLEPALGRETLGANPLWSMLRAGDLALG